MKENRNEIIEEIKNYYEQYLYLLDIYYVALDSELAEKMSEKGKSFFLMATSACVDSYMMTLARLFDENSNSMNIYKLIDDCKKNKNLFDNPDKVFAFLTQKRRILKKEQDIKKTIDTIRHKRNRYFAHNDQAFFSHSKEKDNAVQEKRMPQDREIWPLINFVKELLSELMRELAIDPKEMQSKYCRDLGDLLPIIRERQITPIRHL